MKIRNEKKEGKVGIRRIKRTPTNVSLVNKIQESQESDEWLYITHNITKLTTQRYGIFNPPKS
jgi:hypothetical protein